MLKSRFGYKTPIPTISSRKGQTKQITFTKGLSTYKDNDDLKADELPYVTDARFSRIGRYKTRRGCDRFSVPIGEAVNVEQVSTAGASTFSLSSSAIQIAQKLTVASDGRATRAAIRIKRSASAVGVVLVELREDDGGVPGDLLARGSIRASDVSTSLGYLDVYFIQAPLLATSDTPWVVVKLQGASSSGYEVSTTTNTTTAKTSTDSGATWSSQSYSMNTKLYTSTDGGVKGVFKAYRPGGSKVTFMAHGSDVYTVNETTGATTSIKSGLNASATRYRFQMVQDSVFFVNGLEKPYKYDFSTVTEVTAAPYIANLIMEHKGLLFAVDATDRTRLFFSNFGDYTTYTSTDFIYVPAPKSYDVLTAMAKLNGVLYLFANRNKFALFGSDNATFNLDEATGQKGTYSQESVVYDQNYIWFASDDGIYQFNGTEERNIAKEILEDYMALPSKENITLELYNNRLYVFHSPIGAADNQQCLVYNTLLGVWESLDKETYVGRTFGRYAQEDIFLQASNRVGAVYYGELKTNDYHNLGDILSWELRTAYSHFDSPAQLKRIPKWRPAFLAASADYNVECGYAIDFGEDATYQAIAVGGSGPRYDTGLLYDDGNRYAGITTVEPTSLFIPGSHKRIQRRYRHHAAREPVEMLHEILSVEAQRML